MAIGYSYGSFVLHDNSTYFVEGVEFSWVDIAPATYKIARLEGMKKTGETTDMRQIQMNISVIPPSGTRNALEAALDTMDILLNQRQQPLTLHADGRYFLADCVKKTVPVKQPAAAMVALHFICYQPYAFGATLSNYVASAMMSGGSPYYLNATFTGGGTIFARPTVTITNLTNTTLSNIVLVNQTDNVLLTVTGATLALNDYLTIQCDPFDISGLGYSITKNGNNAILYDFTGIFPSVNPTTANWQIQATAGIAPTISAVWSWRSRYLG